MVRPKKNETKRSSLHFGRKIRKNTLNLEKFTEKSGKKKTQKIHKKGKILQKTVPGGNHFFQLWKQHAHYRAYILTSVGGH